MPTEHYHLHRWQMSGEHKWARVLHAAASAGPGFIERGLRARRRRAARSPSGDLSRAGRQEGHVVGLGRRQDRARAPVLDRAADAPRRRPNDFARMYDLTERVIPAHVLARPALPEHEARKELLVLAAKHHGVGTFDDLDRLPPPEQPDVPAAGRRAGRGGPAASPVEVEGWTKPAYLHPDAKVPRRIDGAALLSPFDPVVWHRDRTERLFGFHYRIEIYVPQPKRQYGYYVLPFLLGDELVGARRPEGRPPARRAAGAGRVRRAGRARRRRGARRWPPSCVSMAGWLGPRARRGRHARRPGVPVGRSACITTLAVDVRHRRPTPSRRRRRPVPSRPRDACRGGCGRRSACSGSGSWPRSSAGRPVRPAQRAADAAAGVAVPVAGHRARRQPARPPRLAARHGDGRHPARRRSSVFIVFIVAIGTLVGQQIADLLGNSEYYVNRDRRLPQRHLRHQHRSRPT